jgi:hypothetical protein
MAGTRHTVQRQPWTGDILSIIGEIEGILRVDANELDLRRVLATVLFTDIVDATKKVVELGDCGWKQLSAEHHRLVSKTKELATMKSEPSWQLALTQVSGRVLRSCRD